MRKKGAKKNGINYIMGPSDQSKRIQYTHTQRLVLIGIEYSKHDTVTRALRTHFGPSHGITTTAGRTDGLGPRLCAKKGNGEKTNRLSLRGKSKNNQSSSHFLRF
jgi:hypothetical protein